MGTLAFLSSPNVVELLAVVGFDFAIIDTEHSPPNPENVLHLVPAAQVGGTAALVAFVQTTKNPSSRP